MGGMLAVPYPERGRIMRKPRTPEYRAYSSAKYRCTNPNSPCWKDYGGRGIEFRFHSFAQFLGEVGKRPEGKTLDRKDNNGNYEPGNVRWATPSQQRTNQRRSPLTEDHKQKVSAAITALWANRVWRKRVTNAITNNWHLRKLRVRVSIRP